MKSWKTTTCGILAILAASINMVLIPILDADPATVADFGTFIGIAVPAIGLLFARDNNVTSEQAGAK